MRPSALLLVVVLAAGCGSTHNISRSVPDDFGQFNEQLQGHHVTIELSDGTRGEGRVVFVRSDSTAWHSSSVRRSVPTSDVVRVIRHEGAGRIFSGALVGAGVGALLTGVALLEEDDSFIDAGSMAPYTILASAVWGALIGAGTGRKVYVFRP
jgi:hypothetical protein